MCDLKINLDSFNPKVLYTFEKKYSDESASIAVHSHDFLSIIYILSGSCTYIINDIPYKVKKGDIIILNPEVNHGKFIASSELIEFHAGFENIAIKGLPKNHLIDSIVTPVITSSKYESDFIKCFSDILNEQSRNELGSELILKAFGMKLLVILLRAANENKISREKGIINVDTYDKLSIVNTITEFINDNYMKDVSLDIISQNMYLSPAYISKIFKEETGESPINYLIKVRLSKAEEYLREGNTSIKEVSHAVGYYDAYHFSKLFKKYYGYPPSNIKMSRNE
jgi:AraC-like DNA-binding protein